MNTFVDSKHEHSLGDYAQKNSKSGNDTSSIKPENTTVPVEIKNKLKNANKTSNGTEYPTTAKEV